jgi:serine/threonine protein kinase
MDKFTETNREPAETPVEHQAARTNLVGSTEHLSPGELVEGHYKILSVIASGGFGCVYKVRNVFTKQIFALKTLHAKAMSETAMLRFRKEAQTASKLDHPNLVRAYDFGLIGEVQPFLVMDFVEGPNLADYLKLHTRIPLAIALDIFIPICYAMSYAHDQGVIHRDIKPGNIILTPDPKEPDRFMAKVVDFGIAKFQFGDESEALTLTRTGEIFGTPLYMSPEQCAGSGTDERSDIYAFGCVMFEALTGAPPFRGNTALETMIQHANVVPLSLKAASLGVDFPDAMERIMARALAKENRNRFQSFAELGNQLLRLQSGSEYGLQLIAVPKGTTVGPEKKLPGRPSWLHAIAFLALGAAISAGIYQCVVVRDLQEEINRKRATINELHETSEPIVANPLVHYISDFYRNDESKPIFQFPAHENVIGDLYCWNERSQKCKRVPAVGTVAVGENTALVLYASTKMLSQPFRWGPFRSDDLKGAVLENNDISKAEQDVSHGDDNAALFAVANQRKLSILDIEDALLSERALKTVGLVESLRFLRIKGGSIETDKMIRKISGADVAEFPNLPNLRTLVLSDVRNVGPLLKRLKNCNLRGLYLINAGLTKQDFQLLKEIRSLESMSIEEPNLDFSDTLNYLAEVPNLKEVIFLFGFSETRAIRRFPKLKRFVFVGPNLASANEIRFRKFASQWFPEGAAADKIYLREKNMIHEFSYLRGQGQNPFKPEEIKLSETTLEQD